MQHVKAMPHHNCDVNPSVCYHIMIGGVSLMSFLLGTRGCQSTRRAKSGRVALHQTRFGPGAAVVVLYSNCGTFVCHDCRMSARNGERRQKEANRPPRSGRAWTYGWDQLMNDALFRVSELVRELITGQESRNKHGNSDDRVENGEIWLPGVTAKYGEW